MVVTVVTVVTGQPGYRSTGQPVSRFRATDSEEKKMTSSSDLPVYAGGPVQSGGDRGHRGDRATGLPFYRDTGIPIPGYRFRSPDSEEKKGPRPPIYQYTLLKKSTHMMRGGLDH